MRTPIELRVTKMATSGGSMAVFRSCPSSSSYISHRSRVSTSLPSLIVNAINQRRNVCCLAVQESSTTSAVAAETKEKKEEKNEEEGGSAAKPKAKAAAKAPAKAPAKPLPELMNDELEGSFLKKGIPYSFWAFFPDGTITGPKGFSISSYGSGVSTVEPFLVDEKKITAKHIVFWVEKRLAAQGIIPVWKD